MALCDHYRHLVEKITQKLVEKQYSSRCLTRMAAKLGMPPVELVRFSELSPKQAKEQLLAFMSQELLHCYDGLPTNLQNVSTSALYGMSNLHAPSGFLSLFLKQNNQAEKALSEVIRHSLEGTKEFPKGERLITTKKALRDWIVRVMKLTEKFLEVVNPEMQANTRKTFYKDMLKTIFETEKDDELWKSQKIRALLIEVGLHENDGNVSSGGVSLGGKVSATRQNFFQDHRKTIIDLLEQLSKTMQTQWKKSGIRTMTLENNRQFYSFLGQVISSVETLHETLRTAYRKSCLNYKKETKTYKTWKDVFNEESDTICEKYRNDSERLEKVVEAVMLIIKHDSTYNIERAQARLLQDKINRLQEVIGDLE